jgi:hypothetical protein
MKMLYLFTLLLFINNAVLATEQPSITITNLFPSIESQQANQETENLDWSKINSIKLKELALIKVFKSKNSDLVNLSLAKYYLTNGNIERAKLFLGRVHSQNKLQFIKSRYLALIAFIENQHQKSYEYLSNDLFLQDPYYSEVCLLKFLEELILKKKNELNRHYNICEKSLIPYSRNEMNWISNMYNLGNKKVNTFEIENKELYKNISSSQESLRLWIKSQLYLNKEITDLEVFKNLPFEVYQSPRTRELMGLYFYRAKKNDLAFRFLEDMSTVNAENIKGNILLKKKEYELALGHFKLALKDKKNSPNALDRAIPLSYIVGLWDDGEVLLKRHLQSKAQERDFLSLKTAFLLRQDVPVKIQEAVKNLKVLRYIYKDSMPNILNSMMGFATLMADDKQTASLYIEQACAQDDGIFCWLDSQQMRLKQIHKTLNREDEIISQKQLIEFNSLKDVRPSSETSSALEENVFVDQQDIEELDSSEAQLYPEMLTR